MCEYGRELSEVRPLAALDHRAEELMSVCELSGLEGTN
jgi:hypothetical protein